MSKVIKPCFYTPLDDRKLIDIADVPIPVRPFEGSPVSAADRFELEQARDLKEQILKDAESAAEARLGQALEEAAALKEQALHEIEMWWDEKRSQDEQIAAEAKLQGYDEGYREGAAAAEEELGNRYRDMLAEAKTVLEQAYEMKEQIIRESEPFLIEMAAAIAEKIIGQELSVSPELTVAMTKSVLSRTRDKGKITLCVAPEHFAFIRDARDELLLAAGSEADLQIIPDSAVGGYGCVIRTEFGSLDARVDTQLKEIKHALQQLSLRGEGDDVE